MGWEFGGFEVDSILHFLVLQCLSLPLGTGEGDKVTHCTQGHTVLSGL